MLKRGRDIYESKRQDRDIDTERDTRQWERETEDIETERDRRQRYLEGQKT